MKSLKNALALGLIALATGCGGGSGGGSGTTSTTSAPVSSVVTDPLSGSAAPGSPTTTVRGTAYKGATVTAYGVQADGSNAASLGTPATANFVGEFTMTLTSAPTGMVRLVATGGTHTAERADLTVQPGKSMELVTPYVTTAFNTFKISPLTHVASHVMAHKAKNGATLANAFKSGMRTVLAIDTANVFVMDDTTVYLNLLTGALKSDKMFFAGLTPDAREMLDAFDWFGVQFDLPTSTAVRVIAAAAENDYPTTNVDGTGANINVGQWASGTFDETAARTLASVMGGQRVSQFLDRTIMDLVVKHACDFGFTGTLTSRYPFYVLEERGGVMAVSTADCTAVTARVDALKARIASNNRTTYMR